ncbi:MAG: hypothetical protein PHS98_03270 [Bacilli bacterium]|nr:hypothetical protein [Bacilli bacterium]
MKIKVIKNYDGNVELVYGDNIVLLTNTKPFIILTEEEFNSIPEYKQYLFLNKFLIADFVEEEIEIKKEQKNKK